MSHMQVETQGNLKYPTSTLIELSKDLGWSNLFAELRSYSRCAGPGTAAPHAEVAIAVGGRPEFPLIGAKRPKIRLPHENSKSILAGSNPSNRHLADCGSVVPSEQ